VPGITARQGAGQGDRLAARRDQGAGRVALRRRIALLLVHFVQDQVVEEPAQFALDVPGRRVAVDVAVHLPQLFAATVVRDVDGPAARLALDLVGVVAVQTQHAPARRVSPGDGFRGDRAAAVVHHDVPAPGAADVAALAVRAAHRCRLPAGAQLGPVAG